LVGDPNVLLLDEPTAGVDEPGQERLNELMRRLQEKRGLTILLFRTSFPSFTDMQRTYFAWVDSALASGRPRRSLPPALLQEMYGTEVDYHVHDC
jgi:ABC-type Mn2+/Zn2+ transport system ATPase subunit